MANKKRKTKKKKSTKKKRKPTPKMLGKGMAKNAGKALQGRKKKLDDQMKKLGI